MAAEASGNPTFGRRISSISAHSRARSRAVNRTPGWVFCLLVAVAMMSGSTWIHSRGIEIGYRAQKAEAELKAVEEGNSQLRARLETLRDFHRVDRWAQASGMVMRLQVDHVALSADGSETDGYQLASSD
ncbi:MAG: hypothetical protein ACUVTZ_05335 [Armatimonadota bacterium]